MLTFDMPLAAPANTEALQALPSSTVGIKAPWLRAEDLPALAQFPKLQGLNLQYTRLKERDLCTMPILPALTHLHLPSSRDFAAPAMQHLAQFPMLSHLSVAFSQKVDDAAISALLATKRWHTLDLSGCRQITDAGLAQLGESLALQALNLYDLREVSGAGLQSLHKHLTLQELRLTNCYGLDDRALHVFASLPKLATLDMHCDAQFTTEGLQTLASCSSLEVLSLASLDLLDDALLQALEPALGSLRKLNVSFSKVTSKSAPLIGSLQQLEALDLYYLPWDDKACEIFPGMKSLVELHLGKSKAQEAGLEQLFQCPSLRRLHLESTDSLPASWFAQLPKHLPHIELLQLYSTDVGPDHLAPLQELTSLRSLNLGYCDNVGPAAIKALAKHPSLEELNLSSTKITDASLGHLAQMPALTNLELTYCDKLTDKGCARLAESSTLHTLSIQGAPLSSATLEKLATALPLQGMSLYDCPHITNDGLMTLLAQHPNCHIDVEARLWQTNPLAPMLALKEDASALYFFHEQEELLVCSSASMRRWSFGGEKLGAVTVRAGENAHAVVSTGDRYVAGGQNSVSVWDLEAGKKHSSFKGSHYITSLAISPDIPSTSSWLAMGRTKLEIVELESGKKQKLDLEKSLLNALAFSPDGAHLWASDGTRLRRWSTRDWQPLPAPDIPAVALSFSPDGTRLCVVQEDGNLLSLDTQHGVIESQESLLSRPNVRVALLANQAQLVVDEDFSKPDDTYNGCKVIGAAWAGEELFVLAYPTYNGSWLWGSKRLLFCPNVTYLFDAESGSIDHVALSPDGRHIAFAGYRSGDYKHWVFQWSIASLQQRFGA